MVASENALSWLSKRIAGSNATEKVKNNNSKLTLFIHMPWLINLIKDEVQIPFLHCWMLRASKSIQMNCRQALVIKGHLPSTTCIKSTVLPEKLIFVHIFMSKAQHQKT